VCCLGAAEGWVWTCTWVKRHAWVWALLRSCSAHPLTTRSVLCLFTCPACLTPHINASSSWFAQSGKYSLGLSTSCTIMCVCAKFASKHEPIWRASAKSQHLPSWWSNLRQEPDTGWQCLTGHPLAGLPRLNRPPLCKATSRPFVVCSCKP